MRLAILTPKNDRAAGINGLSLKSFEGEEILFKSVDSMVQTDDAINDLVFLLIISYLRLVHQLCY